MNDDKSEDAATQAEQSSVELESSLHHEEAEFIVQNYTLASLAPALFPVPLIDLAMLTGIQLKMLQDLSEHYQQEFMPNVSRGAITALISSVVPVALKPALTSSLMKFIPVFGQASGVVSMLVLGAAATHALGQVFIRHFSSGGTIENFDTKAVQDYFMEEFEKGKQIAINMKQQASEYGASLQKQPDDTDNKTNTK